MLVVSAFCNGTVHTKRGKPPLKRAGLDTHTHTYEYVCVNNFEFYTCLLQVINVARVADSVLARPYNKTVAFHFYAHMYVYVHGRVHNFVIYQYTHTYLVPCHIEIYIYFIQYLFAVNLVKLWKLQLVFLRMSVACCITLMYMQCWKK